MENVFTAICYIESRGNPYVVNFDDPNGGSWGVAQIGQLKLNEFNRANKTQYKISDLLDVKLSKRIFLFHCRQYKDIDIAIRSWNGSGEKAQKYLKLVKERL